MNIILNKSIPSIAGRVIELTVVGSLLLEACAFPATFLVRLGGSSALSSYESESLESCEDKSDKSESEDNSCANFETKLREWIR